MNPLSALQDAYRNFTQSFNKPKKQIISPVPVGDTMTSGLEHYYKLDAQKAQQARQFNKGIQPEPTPVSLKYNQSIANAPNERQRRALQIIKNNNPNIKMSDSDIIAKYNKYGEKLLQGLTGGPPRPATPTVTPVIKQEFGQSALEEARNMRPQAATPTPVPGIRVDPSVENFIVNKVFPITRKYGIPDAVAAGQFAQEGRLKGVGAKLNNYFNVGFTDTLAETGQYDRVPRYDTPEAGIEAYARFLTGQADDGFYANGVDGSRSGKIGKKQLQEISRQYKEDPVGFLQAIGPMYSSQGHQYYKNIMQTPEFRRFYYQ